MPTISTNRRALRRRALKAVATRRARAVTQHISNRQLTEKQFCRLSKPLQRQLLALDILKWIRSKAVNVETGRYLSIPYVHVVENSAQANSEEGKTCLLANEQSPGCTVCAKGAVFLAHVMRANKCTIQDLGNSDVSEGPRLTEKFKVIAEEQYDLIECAFEKWESAGLNGTLFIDYDLPSYLFDKDTNRTEYGKLARAAERFGKQHSDDSNRLAAIMINILEHGGEFAPGDRVSADKVQAALKDTNWGLGLVRE